jgi:SpoVK/Ycf46/Vps4 family AAA+-type ATPase
MPSGRPTGDDYTSEIAAAICERIVSGESLRSICRDDAMPAISTVFKWLAKHEDFVDLYARAREAQADTYADEITEIADDGSRDYVQTENGPVIDHDHIARSRLRVDARKWIASKLKPRKYGDKLDLDHSGGLSIQVITGVPTGE